MRIKASLTSSGGQSLDSKALGEHISIHSSLTNTHVVMSVPLGVAVGKALKEVNWTFTFSDNEMSNEL